MAKHFIFLILMALAVNISACGPMNGEKPATTGSAHQDKSLNGVSASQNNLFYVNVTPQSANSAREVGDNVYFIHAVKTQDLGYLSPQTTVSVSYWMPDMPAMGKSDATATRQADGSYTVTLFYSMAGLWQVTVTIQDGSLKDDYVFETVL